jgi:replicative DNA helicase
VNSIGIKADLVIIDYVDLLSSKKQNRERKDEIDDIYVSTKGLARTLNIPIWSVSQVNRAGANDDIIEGDKAAGSYDKLMITDFCMSLSRKKEDKVNGTGRFHIMKNRYGQDGITYGVEADTSIGHFKVTQNYSNSGDGEDKTWSPSTKSNSLDDTDFQTKKRLAEKYNSAFFDLKT